MTMKTRALLVYSLLLMLVVAARPGYSQPAGNLQKNIRFAKRQAGDPLEHLPKNIEVLTSFGERADISPDNRSIAFMLKNFGDAMLINLATRVITCLTCNVPGAAFVRVMHLSNGDYLLTGPQQYNKERATRARDHDLWYLSKKQGAKPVKLGLTIGEGLAISKNTMKLAYTEVPPKPSPVFSRLVTAELDLTGTEPKLTNQKILLESNDSTCTLEAQDFYENDTKLTMFCYVPDAAFEVKGIELKSGQVTNFSNYPNAFNEPEGIFPDGKYTAVEMDRQCEWLGGKRGSGNLDIWKLRLDGSGKDIERLTFFNDYEGGKAANPVVSTDGKFMAFQAARASDPPGIGHGILIYRFGKNRQ
jgi:hypothetical protein